MINLKIERFPSKIEFSIFFLCDVFYFITNFKKSIDKSKKILYYDKNCKAVIFISKIINLFFLSFSINLFITLYSLYSFFYIILFHRKQGSKLEIKKKISK